MEALVKNIRLQLQRKMTSEKQLLNGIFLACKSPSKVRSKTYSSKFRLINFKVFLRTLLPATIHQRKRLWTLKSGQPNQFHLKWQNDENLIRRIGNRPEANGHRGRVGRRLGHRARTNFEKYIEAWLPLSNIETKTIGGRLDGGWRKFEQAALVVQFAFKEWLFTVRLRL